MAFGPKGFVGGVKHNTKRTKSTHLNIPMAADSPKPHRKTTESDRSQTKKPQNQTGKPQNQTGNHRIRQETIATIKPKP